MVLSSNAIIRTGVNTSNRFLRKARVPATIRAGIDNATAATTATSIATATTAGTTIISDPTRPIDISLCLSYQRWCHVKLIQNPPPTGSYHSESLSHRPYCTSSLIVRNQEHKEVIEERGSKSSASSTNSSQQNNNDHDHEVPRSQSSASPFSSGVSPVLDNNDNTTSHGRTRQKFIPRKAAVELTEKARTLFKQLVENHPSKDNVLLNYTQSSTGEPRMVFSFSFVATEDLVQQDEGYVPVYYNE